MHQDLAGRGIGSWWARLPRVIGLLVILINFAIQCPLSVGVETTSGSVQSTGNEGSVKETGIKEKDGAQAEKLAAAEAVERNGQIFVDWPQPQATILFSGELNGYLEPCGCAGLENQLGGLKRRHTLIKNLRQQGWPLVALDLGGQVRRFGPQANIKFRFAMESLLQIGYSGVGLGVHDLQLGIDPVLFVLANLDPENNPLVSANVALFGFESGFSSRYRVLEAGGQHIAVTSILGTKFQAGMANNSEVTWIDPVAALDEVAPNMASKGCDWQVLMVHGDLEEAANLALLYPQFELVASTGGAEVPPDRIQVIEGTNTRLIEVGHKGMYVIAVGLYGDPENSIRYQRVPLDHRFTDSPEMQTALVKYQNELETLGLEGLELAGVGHPRDQFVGSAVCADCHTEATEVFEETPHAHATQTLVDMKPPRHYDPECLSCHVVGWDPQRFFPYRSGYFGLQATPHLQGNGCENCHGPGAAHVAVESGEKEVAQEQQMQLRQNMRLTLQPAAGEKMGAAEKKCVECHDTDNSPDFDFQDYWEQVKHHGKE